MEQKFKIKRIEEAQEVKKQKIISLRVPVKLITTYDELSNKSVYSRNKLICMALKYALDNIDLTEN